MTRVLTGLYLRQQMLMVFDGGSTFDADYPYKWVNIACRLTTNLKKGTRRHAGFTSSISMVPKEGTRSTTDSPPPPLPLFHPEEAGCLHGVGFLFRFSP
jgi:hypothetical protein